MFRQSVVERFWGKVDKTISPNGCWIWIASTDKDGYGRFNISHRQKVGAHRFAWQLINGPIPEGIEVLHKCDNPPCVNHAHLFLGTQSDNILDCLAKGRLVDNSGENHGNVKLTVEEVSFIRRSPLSSSMLALIFSVSSRTIRDARNGSTWKVLVTK